jgi:thiamine kinase-like enzyme
VQGKRFNPLQIARGYAGSHKGQLTTRRLNTVRDLQQDLYAPEGTWVPCHQDLHLGNILGVESPRLIDWEYAAMGDGMFDVAVFCQYHALNGQQQDRLLEACMGDLNVELRERLVLFKALYDALAGLWDQAVQGA